MNNFEQTRTGDWKFYDYPRRPDSPTTLKQSRGSNWIELEVGSRSPYETRLRLAQLDYFVYAYKKLPSIETVVLLVVRGTLSEARMRDLAFGRAAVIEKPPILEQLRNARIPRIRNDILYDPVSGSRDVKTYIDDTLKVEGKHRNAIFLYLDQITRLEQDLKTILPANTIVELLFREWERGDMGVRDLAAARLQQRTNGHPPRAVGRTRRPRREMIAPRTRASLEGLRAALR